MPATMNISLPEPLKKFVDSQIKRGGYAGASDYVRELIRNHQQRVAVDQLRTLIGEGLASGAPQAVDKKYWAAKRKQLRA
ncbi:MAG: type II toxin-antitoxin system ParD family antitoxin [Rudaea sp.]